MTKLIDKPFELVADDQKKKAKKKKEPKANLPVCLFVSFGKDSMTMMDLIVRNNIPVDRYIFSDTLLEYPLMYIYAEKIVDYYQQRYKITIEIIKPNATFEEWCFGVLKRGELKGYIRGIPNPADTDSQCYWRREAKVEAPKKIIGDYIPMLGYTRGEGRNTDGALTPLKSDFLIKGITYKSFNMSEWDCKLYLEEREMENPIYKLLTRTGCAMCPFQSERAWYVVWKHFPDIWDDVKWIEKRLKHYEERGMKVINRFWFPKYATCAQMEEKFSRKDVYLMDFSDEPVKDCLCKF